MGSSKGGECELGLPESYGDDIVGDGDVVPGQLDDVFDVLTEDDDQDGGHPVARGELVGVDHTLDGRVLFGLGQLGARSPAVPRDAESASTKRHLIAQGMKRSTNLRVLGPSAPVV